jgi:hypothetical protein
MRSEAGDSAICPDPSLDPFPNAAIGAFLAELFEPLISALVFVISSGGDHSWTRSGSVRRLYISHQSDSYCSDSPVALALTWVIRNGGFAMAPQITDQKWYSIAEQASTEMDSAKLAILVAQLCEALDEHGKPPALQPPTLPVPVN